MISSPTPDAEKLDEILPDGQMNVLVDSNGVFVATNQANPRRWKKIVNADGSESYVAVP